jgi:hypothetical protein
MAWLNMQSTVMRSARVPGSRASLAMPKLIAMDVTIPDLTVTEGAPFVVSLAMARCVPPVVEQLRDVLRTHPGNTEQYIYAENFEISSYLE